MKRLILTLLTATALVVTAGNVHGAGRAAFPHHLMPVNSHAVPNSNGIWSADRDKGLQRAADRHQLKADHIKHHQSRQKKSLTAHSST